MGEWNFVEKSLRQAIEVTDKELAKGKFDLEKWSKELWGIDALKDINAYYKSEENLRDCEPFEQLNQKYISLHKRYNGLFNELHEDVKSKVNRREYTKGGTGFHRGFYSPSMIDLIVDGINRGRLLKKPPKSGNHTYEYLFDEEDRLICVYFYGKYDSTYKPDIAELFVYENDKVLSFEFEYTDWNGYKIARISECQYDNGSLMRYEIACCSLLGVEGVGDLGKNCGEINVETFEYAGNLLQSFCWYCYNPSVHSLTQEKYTFNRDEEGYLSTYTLKQLGGFRPKTNFDREQVIYKVRVKRK